MMFDLDLAKYKKSPCLISENNTLSYCEVDLICSNLESLFSSKKQLILVKAKINIETIIGYLSFLRASQAFIMLDASIDEELTNNIIQTYQPNFIWEECIRDSEYVFEYGDYGLKKYNEKDLSLHPKLSLMLSTSGTTGSPKMVKLTKENLYANCASIIDYLKIDETHRAITNLPLYYSYGLSVLNTHLEQGASIVVSNKSIISKEFWETFNTFNVTTLSGVPYNYEVFRRIGLMKMKLPSLKYMTQAGGKLNYKLVKEYAIWAKRKNIEFIVMYGQTEATARISYLPFDKILEKESSIGIVIPNGKLLIKDLISESIIDENFVNGELIYRGKNTMMGYATQLNDLSKEDELKGVLHTGDIAYKDEDGYFYITGRLKRFIKIHGNRVGLDEIEQFLKSEPYDILCSGVDNKLMIVTREKDKIEAIKKDIIKKYSFHHSVVKVKEVEDYPITSAGKIKYQEIIKLFIS
jgi:acyl-coenzyme A synthetase/AMP-(fatty) acid ligase